MFNFRYFIKALRINGTKNNYLFNYNQDLEIPMKEEDKRTIFVVETSDYLGQCNSSKNGTLVP